MLPSLCATANACRHSRLVPLSAAILAILAVSLAVPASAQQQRRFAPGTVIIPPSNHLNAEDLGLKAHTNLRLIVPPNLAPSEAPPSSGYGYETPASLACVYLLVQPIRGCNPNSTTRTPAGGSQTITIVDAYDDPKAASDLQYFSSLFGIPFQSSKFKVVYASGKQPATDPTGGWELEEALDIEYSHAMAPNAMLYLVEADTNSLSDLLNAVLVASNLVRCGKTTTCPADSKGKGEVSISWGGDEFSNEADYDFVFSAPNVVFLAATGDAAGVIFPSVSPNVIGVGGTSTARSLSTGNLIEEIAWSDAGGGLSLYQPAPPYQSVIAGIAQGYRALPDVSADANPNNGVWEYDSFPYNNTSNPSNWWIVGGTSLATPTVAGILNAVSTASNYFAPSSQAQLTQMYFAYSNRALYSAHFSDITYGACNYYSGSFSAPGYDLCTGLGSPKGVPIK